MICGANAQAVDDVEELIRRIRARESSAFEALYDAYSRLVFGIALRMLGDADSAEDAVQAIFLKVWSAPERYQGGNFAAWITRVTRNHSLDQLRRRSRAKNEEFPRDMPTDDFVDDLVFARLSGTRVREALLDIPEEQRIPIELGFFAGITHVEIAQRVAVPLGTVKTRIRSGLQKLRRALGDEVAR